MINALSVDVEEHFHATEVQATLGPSDWDALPSRVADQTMRVLDLLARHGTKATFFVLGWVAERRPALVREIAAAGHEIGCHSYAHRLVYDLGPAAFRDDTRRAVAAIADAAGLRPAIYRAPSYSITAASLWALEVLVECGFHCDSSIFPIAHDRYGIPGFGRHSQVLNTPSGPIREVPLATVELSGSIAPVAGGGYLRLLPYRYTAAGIRRVNHREGQPACMYFHPWELDPAQPRLARGCVARLRSYTGLRGMHRKVVRLLSDFRFAPVGAVFGGAAVEVEKFTR